MSVHHITPEVIQNAINEINNASIVVNQPNNIVTSHHINTVDVKDGVMSTLKSAFGNRNCVIVGVLILIVLGLIVFKKDKKVPKQNIIYF